MSSASELLDEICRLMELKGENPFKVRAFEKASQIVAGRDDLVSRAKSGTLTELAGIGKGIAEILTEFLLEGRSTARDELLNSLPKGLTELTSIPGLGPKKARQLIEALEIHSIAELEYACRENRLLKLKGFGEKAQKKIIEGIQFCATTQGRQRLPDALAALETILPLLTQAAKGGRVSETGALRRRTETVGELEFLTEKKAGQDFTSVTKKFQIQIHFTSEKRWGYDLAKTTATGDHWQALGAPAPFAASTEEEFFAHLKLPVIPPEMRETGEEIALARGGKVDSILPERGVRGVFHNHTTYSDGAASIEEMVTAAMKLGYEYIGISDHSRSAFYAQGLSIERLKEQEREIQKINGKYPGIRIFWGIESDILADGSLDYEPAVLKRFDFVIASIHSRFQMDREAMTQRILEAIRNPYTRFLGHATGRLLLGRKGDDVDMEKIIAEAAVHDVAIELNSNPARLDIDWRWGPELRKRKTRVSINPDAHETAGLEDTRYGITMARKALLPVDLIVNARSAKEVERWLKRM